MNLKRILIIDDSEIDREILKNILKSDFDISEADNGYKGIEMLIQGIPHVDAVVLDVSMPVIDGFGVLQLMIDNKVNDIPVVLITAEATKANVQRAAAYNVSEFVSKPFDPEVILNRVKGIFNISPTEKEKGKRSADISDEYLTDEDIEETNEYISRLKDLYKTYLHNRGKSRSEYSRIASLVRILVKTYSNSSKKVELDSAHIDIISKAAYFYDIGQMLTPDEDIKEKSIHELYESHTTVGADIIRLNTSPGCRFFVKIASDICAHHHERNDGKGFPHRLRGAENSIYAQFCTIAISFDRIFIRRPSISEEQFEFVLNEITVDNGAFAYDVVALMRRCRSEIVAQYKKSNLKNHMKNINNNTVNAGNTANDAGTANNDIVNINSENGKEIMNIYRMGIK